MRMREWNRRGFVQLSPHKQKLRHRILPRTVIGISFMLLSAGVGAAFSGAAFYAYYDNRLAENERTVARFVEGFDQQFTDASGALNEMQVDAVSTIRSELAPLDSFVSDARGVVNLPATAGPSVWLLETRNEAGRLVNGSAFAVVGHRGGTALVTSHDVIAASTIAPGPGIDLIKGNERIPARLWAWDEERDLALLVVDRQIPVLEMAGAKVQVEAIGGTVFAMSGFGGQGATAAPGVLLDHSQLGLQHTAPVGTLYVGGPLLDGQGRVLGVASGTYQPFGVDPGAVGQAPDVAGICARILRCSEVEEGLTAETVE
jgi:S1-C subfamily serine protease